MSLSVDYNGVDVSFDESDVIDTLDVIDCYDSEVEVLGYDEYGVEYTAVGIMSCDELVEIDEESVWPVDGEGFNIPDVPEHIINHLIAESELIESLVDNDVDDGSWVGR
tara:strand:- start:328 stop:654 length:327 start_codon:yes stop_codon:yes gene_type:complete